MINNVTIMGRLTMSNELQKTTTGKSRVWNVVAINEGKNAKGEEITQYVPFVCYGGWAEHLAADTEKGDMVAIKGRIMSYKTNENVSKILVNAEQVFVLTPRKRAAIEEEEVKEDQVDAIDPSLPF